MADVRLAAGLPREMRRNALDRLTDGLDQARLAATGDRVGAGQQFEQEGVRSLGARGRRGRDPRLVGGNRESHGERRNGGAGRGDRDPVAPHEESRPIHAITRPRLDRPVGQPALEVVAEGACARVAPLDIHRQRLQQHPVEIAIELPRPRRDLRGSQRERFGVEDRARAARDLGAPAPFARRQRAPRILDRQASGQQLEQHQPEGVDVGCDRQRSAVELLGTRVLRGQRPDRGRGQAGRQVVERLRDPEVQQLDLAINGDQDVRGLEVPVQDQRTMRMVDRLDHVEEQPHPRPDVEPAGPAPAVDRLAVDVLHRDPRPAIGLAAAVDDPRDAGMLEAGEEAALGLEALDRQRTAQADGEALDGGALAEAPALAHRLEDLAHAARAKDAEDPPAAEGLRHASLRIGFEARATGIVRGQQGQRIGAQCRIVGGTPADEIGACCDRVVQRRLEQAQRAGVEPAHESLRCRKARATSQSRSAVAREMPSSSEISLTSSPPK